MSANSNGAVTSFTTTSTYPSIPATGSRQLGPVTVETEITTTDSRGSTIVATSTYVSVATATTTHYLSTEITATCPQDNSTYYVAGEYTYEIYWGFDFYGSDLPDLRTDNLADRLLACSDYTPETGPYGAAGASCVAASFQTAGNKCYLKHGEYEINNRIPEFPAVVQFNMNLPSLLQLIPQLNLDLELHTLEHLLLILELELLEAISMVIGQSPRWKQAPPLPPLPLQP